MGQNFHQFISNAPEMFKSESSGVQIYELNQRSVLFPTTLRDFEIFLIKFWATIFNEHIFEWQKIR